MARISIDVEVDIDEYISEIDDEDILAEAENRGLIGAQGELGRQREAMLRALWENNDKHAIRLLQDYLCDVLNRSAI